VKISMRAARINKNISRMKEAEALGVSYSTIVKWENETSVPSADKFLAFCELVAMSPDDIRVPGSCLKDNEEAVDDG